MNSILPGIFFSPWQEELTMTRRGELDPRILENQFGINSILDPIVKPNQSIDYLLSQINNLIIKKHKKSISSYTLEVVRGNKFIKVWLILTSSKQKIRDILYIYESNEKIEDEYTCENKTISSITVVRHGRDNLKFNSWDEITDNDCKEFISFLDQCF